MKTLCIRRACAEPRLEACETDPVWAASDVAEVDAFRPESSDHRPRTRARLLWYQQALYGLFTVEDCYVRSVCSTFQDSVCTDSCVEFFVKPAGAAGYFNFEFNAGGVLLASYIEDPERTEQGFRKFRMMAAEDAAGIRIFHSLPDRVDPELTVPTVWRLGYSIPFPVLERYMGRPVTVAPDPWHANFYKCGDRTSHRHWAAWSPVPKLNFHDPASFGELRFE